MMIRTTLFIEVLALGCRVAIGRDRQLDAVAADLPAGGLISLRDSEAGASVVVETAIAAPRLRTQSEARLADLPRRLRAARVDYAILPTDEPYLRTLTALFRRRTRRQ